MDTSWLGELQLYASGTLLTIELLLLSALIGIAIAIPVALGRLSGNRLLAWPALAYSAFFRGTPLLVQIYLIYYGLAQFEFIRHSPLWVILRQAYPCALIAFSMNMGAYVSEVVRGGIASVPKGETEAARALALTSFQRYRLIVLPRAFRLMLPALGNETVIQLKSTSLASVITLLDLTGVGRRLAAATYSTDPLLLAGLIYAALAWLVGTFFRRLEIRLNQFQRR